MAFCPECGAEVSEQAKFCSSCGHGIGRKKYCKHCGEKIDEECIICPKCGKQVEEIKQAAQPQNIIINNNNNNDNNNHNTNVVGGGGAMVSPKSWLATLLLCLFLGALSIHRFYVGKIGTAILQIILMPTGIGAIWLLIDLIKIILKRFTDSRGLLIVN